MPPLLQLRTLLTAWLALSSAPALLAQESKPAKVALRLTLKKGDALRYRTTQHSIRVMSGHEMGGADLTQEYGFEVLGVDQDGSYELGVQMGAIKGRLQMGAGRPDLEFDSTATVKPDAPPANGESILDASIRQKLVALSGRTFRAVVTPGGDVKEVRGLAEMLKAAFPQPDGSQSDQVARSLFTETSIRQSLQELFFQFGPEPVGEGDSWGNDTPLPVGVGQYVLAKTRKLLRLAAESATLSIDGRVKTVEPAKKPDDKPGGAEDSPQSVAQALKRTQVEKAEYKAEATVDRASGAVRRQTAEMSIHLLMDLGTSGKMRVEQRMRLLVERL